MYALKNAVFTLVQTSHTLLCRSTPCQKDHSMSPLCRYDVNHLLGELLPPLVRVTIGLMCSDSQTSVQEKNASICPRCQEASLLGRRFELGVVFLDCFVDVQQRRRCRSRRPNREAHSMGLINIVIRVLSKDHDLDFVQRTVARPRCLSGHPSRFVNY